MRKIAMPKTKTTVPKKAIKKVVKEVINEFYHNEKCEIEVAPGKKVNVEYDKEIFDYDEVRIKEFKKMLKVVLDDYYEGKL